MKTLNFKLTLPSLAGRYQRQKGGHMEGCREGYDRPFALSSNFTNYSGYNYVIAQWFPCPCARPPRPWLEPQYPHLHDESQWFWATEPLTNKIKNRNQRKKFINWLRVWNPRINLEIIFELMRIMRGMFSRHQHGIIISQMGLRMVTQPLLFQGFQNLSLLFPPDPLEKIVVVWFLLGLYT